MSEGKYSYPWVIQHRFHKELVICLIIAIVSYIFLSGNLMFFHTIAGYISVIIAFMMASIALTTYWANVNKSIIFLGIAYGFIGIFDLVYLVINKGITSFGENPYNVCTQLWIVARYMESISFLIAFILRNKRIEFSIRKVLFTYLLTTIGLLVSILYSKIFPTCIIGEDSITLFKILSECIIIGNFIASIVYLTKQNQDYTMRALIFIIMSLASGAISEIFFLFYLKESVLSSYGFVFKLLSYYFLYTAIVKTSLQEPYIALSSLNSSLMEKNEKLARLVYELEIEYEYRKKIERENLRKGQMLNGVLESTIDGILVLDNDKNLLHINGPFIKIMDIPSQVVLNGDIEGIMNCIKNNLKNPEDFDMSFKGILNTRTAYTCYLRHKNYRIYEVTSLPYIDNGQVSGVVISFRDITDREMVEELKKNIEIKRELLEKAKEIDEMKSSFFTTISHEIRTPLNIILGIIQLLSYEEANENKEYYQLSKENIKALQKNSYRLIKLADNLMDITKFDSGYLHLNLLNHDIISIIRNTTYSVATYLENTDISVEFKSDIDERIMACDKQKIERVLLNLLSNAVKFTESKGHILVSLENDKDSITIKVKDNGIGIPSHMIDKIFDKLKQVDNSLRRSNEGTGIGLSIVKSIVEMHGGSISVKSKIGQGSEFTIRLPVYLVKEEDSRVYDDTCMGIDRVNIEFSDIYGIN